MQKWKRKLNSNQSIYVNVLKDALNVIELECHKHGHWTLIWDTSPNFSGLRVLTVLSVNLISLYE